MVDLLLHGRQVRTVFELLGQNENDITYSAGWALASSESFLREFLRAVFPSGSLGTTKAVYLQEHATSGGFTDIEIVTDKVHVIVEAKRGWNLPSDRQLASYASRLEGRRAIEIRKSKVRNVPIYAA